MKILYEDRSLILPVKPVGVLSQKGEQGDCDMLSLLDSYFAEKNEKAKAYVLHRLDKNVGGVMVYAKDQKTAAAMSGIIARGEMVKEYFAVCHGDVTASLGESGELSDLLFKDSAKNKSYVVDRMRRGVKEAKLSYRVLGTALSEDGILSLLRIRLFTGRTHQIRVQFSSRSHPLLGDARYGSRHKGCDVALFSASLSFRHPKSGKELVITENLPKGYPWDLFSKEDLT